MVTIHVIKRDKIGKSFNRRLRSANRLPGVVYGGKEKAIPIEMDPKILMNIHLNPNFNKELVLIIENELIKVNIKAIQRHPFKPKLYHVDFIRI